jgi:two-component system phosphate regulon response regulator OmpR
MMENKVLLVDDDEKLRKLLKEYFEGYGFSVESHGDGLRVVETLQSESPDMVILDVMMPKKNGLDVLKDIRKVSQVPVIMLTAKGEETDRIVGLELGADDYLSKPFSPRELLARVHAVLRRIKTKTEGTSEEEKEWVVAAGGLTLNGANQSLRINKQEVGLSYTEYRILEALMRHPNRVLSRDQIMNLAKGKDFMAFDRSIDVHISKLRAKVETDPSSPERIKTVWGAGYMFVDKP